MNVGDLIRDRDGDLLVSVSSKIKRVAGLFPYFLL